MRRAAICCFIVGVLIGTIRAADPLDYRGQTVDEWLQQLSHPSASARAAAAQAFVKVGNGNEAAVEPLIGLLSDRDERVRFYAAYALGKIETRHEPCIRALIKALPDKDEHVRYAAQWSLAQIAKQIARTTDANLPIDASLANLLAEAETQLLVAGALPGHLKQVRTAIAGFSQPAEIAAIVEPPVLASSDEPDEIDECVKALASGEILAQAKAIETLRKLGPQGIQRLLASPETVANLGPASWWLPEVIASLGEPVVPILMDALRHPNHQISDLAASGLKALGPSSSIALPGLIELIENEETSEAARQRAIRIIVAMGPAAEPATDLLVQLLSDVDLDASIQQSAAEALGAIGPDARRSVPALIARIANSDVSDDVRVEFAAALARIAPKSEEVTQALVAAFHDSESIFDAISIAESLCQCGPGATAIVPRLIEAIDETSFDERAAVVRLLGILGSSSAEDVKPILLERLMDPSEELMVRVAAANALGALGPDAVQLLIDQLNQGNAANQLMAARALVEIGLAAKPAKGALYAVLIERYADNELCSLAAVALGQLGPNARDVAPTLAGLMRDPDSDSYLRSMCAVALGQVDPFAAPILEAMLDDSEIEVRIASAYALCKIEPQHARGLATLLHWLASDEYRGPAGQAIIDVGESALPGVVETMNDASNSRDTRIACLQVLNTFDERAITPLLRALNDQELADEAGWALRDRGNEMLPTLVASIEDQANFTPRARAIMGSVIEDMFVGLGGGDGEATWQGGHPLVRRPEAYPMEMSAEPPEMAAADSPQAYGSRNLDGGAVLEEMPKGVESPVTESDITASIPAAAGYKTVEVFYGTNRQPLDDPSIATGGQGRWLWLAGAVAVFAVVALLIGLYRRGGRRRATAGLAGTTLLLLLGLFVFARHAARPSIEKLGPRYGGGYSDRVEMGICRVTIPDTHREGELESPTLLRLEVAEDLERHIVLRSVQRLESDAFFAGVRRNMQNRGNHILVFIHGYNVSFEDAARRTAQMSSDLKFAGASIFYSWPSQADWRKYRVDEKNVELSVDQLKEFLLAIAERSEADTINLVAHSMGNRALADALKEMDVAAAEHKQMFNQVILAAPDIDADIFKQRIAPAIVGKAKHITLYASSKDLALAASRTFNSGDPRAGDAGKHLVVFPGIDTIDVSSGDSSLWGHSYYGDNISVLRDIELLLRDQPASARRFLEPVSFRGDLTYWMFQPERLSRRIETRDGTR